MRAKSLTWEMLRPDDFVLAPLPNHLFQRDNSCWVYGGVTVNPMAKPARQRETLHTRAIYRYHPMFADADFITYFGDDDTTHFPATIEGGDVHVVGHRAVLVGMGERTSPMAVEAVAHALFSSDQADRVVAVELPHSHAFMHLDTVMSMVDRDSFILYPYFDRHLRSWTLTPGQAPGQLSRRAKPQSVGDAGPHPRRGRDHRAHDRRGHPSRRAGTMGRRHQLLGRGARRRHGLRAQRRHEHDAAKARHRGDFDQRQRARSRTRRPTVHDLPDRARSGLRRTTMTIDLRGRSFLKEADFTKEEFAYLISEAALLREEKRSGTEVPRLTGRNIALIFEKTSTRTRSAFEVAAHDQGAHVTYMGPDDSQLGRKESMRDTARVLGQDVRRDRIPRLRPGRRRDLGPLRRSSGLERADRPVAPDPDAGGRLDDARPRGTADRGHRLLLRG